MGVCLSGCNIEAQHEQNEGRGGEGGTQGIKVAHFYLCTHSTTALQGNNVHTWTHTEGGRLRSYLFLTVATTLEGLDTTRKATLVHSALTRCIPACRWCNPQWVTSLIMCLRLQKCQLRREAYISQTVQKIVFQARLTACIPITSSPRSEIADSSPAVRRWVSLNVFGL